MNNSDGKELLIRLELESNDFLMRHGFFQAFDSCAEISFETYNTVNDFPVPVTERNGSEYEFWFTTKGWIEFQEGLEFWIDDAKEVLDEGSVELVFLYTHVDPQKHKVLYSDSYQIAFDYDEFKNFYREERIISSFEDLDKFNEEVFKKCLEEEQK